MVVKKMGGRTLIEKWEERKANGNVSSSFFFG